MPTYGEYLKLDQLLELQHPLSRAPEHDEMLFIVIHQVYELWFKEILHEIDYLQELLSRTTSARARGTRSSACSPSSRSGGPARYPGDHDAARVPELPRPARVRERLPVGPVPRAGVLLGWKEPGALERYPAEQPGPPRLEAPSRRADAVGRVPPLSGQNGIAVPAEDLQRDVTASRGLARAPPALIEVYRHHPALAELCERLVDLDEGLMEWRYRHVKMVQRTIGTRRGTGGSAGAEYLTTTLDQPLFPDLWAIRTEL